MWKNGRSSGYRDISGGLITKSSISCQRILILYKSNGELLDDIIGKVTYLQFKKLGSLEENTL